jgi:hypothetical protein
MRTVTVWENDMVEVIDHKTLAFIKAQYPDYEVKQLSGLSHRHAEDILDSVRNSHTIVIQPNLLDIEQIVDIAQLLSNPIHVNNTDPKREYDIRRFLFLTNYPWDTCSTVKSMLSVVKDSVNELCLMKILKHCAVDFCNFDCTEYYEMQRDGYFNVKIYRTL